MNDKCNPNPQLIPNKTITGSTIVAIISIVFAAAWIAFAYYKGTNSESADGDSILLLHPVVSILLIVLLLRTRHLIDVKSVVDLHILMIAIWLFKNLVGVLMPFILGFGIAYFIRFLLDAMQEIPRPKGKSLQLSRGYARGILTVFILGIFALLFLYIIPQIGKQSHEMSKGLVRFYHQSIVPFVVGSEFTAVAIQSDTTGALLFSAAPIFGNQLDEGRLPSGLQQDFEKNEIVLADDVKVSVEKKHGKWLITDTGNGKTYIVHRKKDRLNIYPEVICLGTEHGVYRFDRNRDKLVDITDGELIGQSIQAIATAPYGKYQFFVGTSQGLYGRMRVRRKDDGFQDWHRVGEVAFLGKSIQAIATPISNLPHVYVGTHDGLLRSTDNGATWENMGLAGFSIQSIVHIPNNGPKTYVATDKGVYYTKDTEHWLELSLDSLTDNLAIISDSSADEPPIRIQTLVVAADDAKQVYAGTSRGMYRWNTLEEKWSQDSDASLQLPESISLLLAHSQGGLYAGNREVIYYRNNVNSEWKLVTLAEEGILTRLEDVPMVGGTGIVDRVKDYLKERLPTLARTGSEFVGTLVKSFSSFALGLGGFLATLFLTLMVFIYASQSFVNYIRSFINVFPENNRAAIRLYLVEIDRNLQSFLQGQVTVILIISIISIVIYSIIGVPFALVVGLLAGLCNAIPTFGPYIGGVFALLSMLMGFAAGNFESMEFLIRVAVLLGAIFGIQAVDNSLISPKVMSNAVDVDPLLIMFGVIVGALLLGFWGVILAIPTLVVIKSVLTVSREIREEEGT